VLNMVTHPVETASGLYAMAEHVPFMAGLVPNPLKLAHAGADIIFNGADPKARLETVIDPGKSLQDDAKFGKALVDGFVEPYKKSWAEGKYFEVAGRATFDIGSMFIGAGEANAAIKTGEVASVASKTAEVANVASKAGEVSNVAAKTSWVAEVASTAEKVWNGAKTWGREAWNGTKALGNDALAGARAWGGEAWNGTKALGDRALGGAKNLGDRALVGAKNLGDRALVGAKNLGNRALNAADHWGYEAQNWLSHKFPGAFGEPEFAGIGGGLERPTPRPMQSMPEKHQPMKMENHNPGGQGQGTPGKGGTPSSANSPQSSHIDKVREWKENSQITGDLKDLEKRLNSPDKGNRLGAEAEVRAYEQKIKNGEIPEVQGKQPGTDFSNNEIKARTEPFNNDKQATNFFNDRIKKANSQYKKSNSTGSATIDLGSHVTINGKAITPDVAREIVQEAMSKGNRGSELTEVIVVDGSGKIIYRGMGN
jgi:hypothetical protein